MLPLSDHLGTVRDLAVVDNGVTSVANHIEYDSFGKVESMRNQAVECLMGFTGRPVSTATGLQNNLNRWLDSSSQRWMSKDPVGFKAGNTNVGRYVGNAVTCVVDPSGLAEPPKSPPLPPEPEHGFWWWAWNTISSWVLPPPVAALEGAPDAAKAIVNRTMMERAQRMKSAMGQTRQRQSMRGENTRPPRQESWRNTIGTIHHPHVGEQDEAAEEWSKEAARPQTRRRQHED